MENNELQKVLNQFGKYVVSQSRANLTRGQMNASKNLYNSIDFEAKATKDGFNIVFTMPDYGFFQDKGVSGVKKKYNTPYAYTSKMPPAKAFANWVVRRGLEGVRDKKTGRFITRQSLQWAIARSVYLNGIKPTYFFSVPLERAKERFTLEILKALGDNLFDDK
jgi:hypothetical protein